MVEPPFPGARLVASPARVREAWTLLAGGLQAEVDAGPCLLLGVLLGGMVPLVEISRRLEGDFLIDYCHLTRYSGDVTGGDVRWLQRPHLELRGLTVVIVDDIFDQGHTLAELRRHCEQAGAARVLTAVLARKRHDRPVADREPDFRGLEVGDEYVFGCGMDYRERWRHLDAIYAVARG